MHLTWRKHIYIYTCMYTMYKPKHIYRLDSTERYENKLGTFKHLYVKHANLHKKIKKHIYFPVTFYTLEHLHLDKHIFPKSWRSHQADVETNLEQTGKTGWGWWRLETPWSLKKESQSSPNLYSTYYLLESFRGGPTWQLLSTVMQNANTSTD